MYDASPQQPFAVLKWQLKRDPKSISEIVGSDNWGYQIVTVTVEKIHSNYPLTENADEHAEGLREAVKLYDPETGKFSYLAADSMSVIGHLSNYKSEFVRIFVFDEKAELDYQKISQDIGSKIQA